MEIPSHECSTLGIDKKRTEDKQKQTSSNRGSEVFETETNIIEFEFFETDVSDSEPLTENNNDEELDEEDVVDRIFQAANSGKEKDLSNLIFSSHYRNQDISDVGLTKRNNKISFPLKRKSTFHGAESEESSKKPCQKILNFKNIQNKQRPARQTIKNNNNNNGCFIPITPTQIVPISTALNLFSVQPSAESVNLNLPSLVSTLSLPLTQKAVSASSSISSSSSSFTQVPVSTTSDTSTDSQYNTAIDFSVLTKALADVLGKSIGLNEKSDIKLVLFCNDHPVKSFSILKTPDDSLKSEFVNNLVIQDSTKSDVLYNAAVNDKKQAETLSANGYDSYHIEGNEIKRRLVLSANNPQSTTSHEGKETRPVQVIKQEIAQDDEYGIDLACSKPKDKKDIGRTLSVTKIERASDQDNDSLESVSISEHFESTPSDEQQDDRVKPSKVAKDQKSTRRCRSRSHKKTTKNALVKPVTVLRIEDGLIQESVLGDATHLTWTQASSQRSSVDSPEADSTHLESAVINSPEELTDINIKLEVNEEEESEGNLVINESELIEDKGFADKKKGAGSVSLHFECDVCAKVFAQRRYLNRHKSVVHGIVHSQSYKKNDVTDLQILPEENRVEYCEKTIDEFLSDQLEEQKIKTGEIDITNIAVEPVPHSDEDFINLLLKRKTKFHNKEINSDEVSPQYKIANLQNLARIEKLGKFYEIPPVFVCEHCGKFYRSRKSLKEHFVRLHASGPGQEPLYIFIEKNSFICTLCFTSFPDPYQLVAHSRDHVKDSLLKCVLCAKTYSSVYVLRRHIDTVHQDLRPRPFKCKLCSYAASNRWHLTEHERRHTGEQPFQCPVCLKNFSHQGTMNRHCKVIHNVIPGEPKRLFYPEGSDACMPQVISPKKTNTPSSTPQKPEEVPTFEVNLSNFVSFMPVGTANGKVQLLKPVPVSLTGPNQGASLIGNTGLVTEKDPADGNQTNTETVNPIIVIKTEPLDDI